MTGLTDADRTPPPPCSGPAVWTGPELADPGQWRTTLSETGLAEIDSALRETRRRDLTLLRLTAADFPLPGLGADLERLSGVLGHGRGFAVVRGIPVERLGETAASTVFWGSAYTWGTPYRRTPTDSSSAVSGTPDAARATRPYVTTGPGRPWPSTPTPPISSPC